MKLFPALFEGALGGSVEIQIFGVDACLRLAFLKLGYLALLFECCFFILLNSGGSKIAWILLSVNILALLECEFVFGLSYPAGLLDEDVLILCFSFVHDG